MAVFGVKYYGEMRSKFQGISWRVDIAQRGYTGPSEEMTFSGTSPIKVTWERRGDDFYTPVKASEASINILCKDNFHYLGLFTSDPREYRLSLYRNGSLFWRGFIVADLYSERFAAPPYDVTIKAVDGFNILQNLDFKDLLGMGTTGRKSLHQLLTTCIEVLELEMSTSIWLDLIPEGIADTDNPLQHIYLDLERLFYVYEEPSYRDILELCLAPFGAQIFQSGACIHIRRVVSLFDEYRPWHYANLMKDRRRLPRAVSSGKQRDTYFQGIRIVNTNTTRLVQNDLWEDGVYIIGNNTTLDIVPAIRNAGVTVKNKALDNLAGQLGFTDPAKWVDQYGLLLFGDDGSVSLSGNSDHANITLITTGCPVKQCNFDIVWECMLKAVYSNYTTSGGGSSSSTTERNNTHTSKITFGVKVAGSGGTVYWLDSDGGWNDYETDLEASVTTGTDESFKVEMTGFPCDGTLYFYIMQTLVGFTSSTGSGRTTRRVHERVTFYDIRMSIDAGDLYDQGLVYHTLVNPANNVDLDIQLPVSDIPAIPNDLLLYSLYFEKADGSPTRLWRTRGKEDYATLVTHMAISALRMRQIPAKRLSGEIFTALHLDLNSVFLDDKYLNAGFYVNSLEVDGLTDAYNAELVELPRLIDPDIPEQGDDCVRLFAVDTRMKSIVQAIRCLDFLLLRTDRDEVYRFDTVTRQAVLLYYSEYSFTLFEASNGFVRVERGVAHYCDYRGVVRRQLTLPDTYGGFITFRENYFWMLAKYSGTMQIVRPEITASVSRSTGGVSHGELLVTIYGTSLRRAVVTKNQIAITTNQAAYVYDCRYHTAPNVFKVADYFDIFAITDDYMLMSDPDADLIHVYRRNSITTWTRLSPQVGRWAYHADLSQTKVAFAYEGTGIYKIGGEGTYRVRNNQADWGTAVGLFFIYGDLYIVQKEAVYKFIKEVDS